MQAAAAAFAVLQAPLATKTHCMLLFRCVLGCIWLTEVCELPIVREQAHRIQQRAAEEALVCEPRNIACNSIALEDAALRRLQRRHLYAIKFLYQRSQISLQAAQRAPLKVVLALVQPGNGPCAPKHALQSTA